jgi:hypothetical protein
VRGWWRSPLIIIPAGAAGFVALIMIAALGVSLTSLNQANAACTVGPPVGPGPLAVAGIPPQFLPYFEGASSYFQLGGDGWAYLAALNYAESRFDSPGAGVFSGSNSAGAAGPMQIGIGGAATDNWDAYKLDIPATLPGGTQPPSVYNEADAVYAAGAKLRNDGAPADWLAALTAWNDYPPEIQEVTSLVAQYTQAPATGAIAPAAGPTVSPTPGGACAPVTGPSVPGAAAQILPDGTAAFPADAPAQVQEAIAAGNRIIDTSYSTERDPNMLSTVMPSYDCSGSTDYVLYNAGLNAPQVDVGSGVAGNSTLLESYSAPGAGQWITVFASAGHAFIEVAGLVLDTSHYAATAPAGTGPRWQPASILSAQLADGNVWTQRHPVGL